MKDSAVRKKILEAAIESIEKNGIEGCTIRSIAKEAGMTFSSLHYYFESKEQLVDDAMSMALSNSFVDLVDIWKNRTDDQVALQDMLLFLFDGAIRYPGVTRASLHALLMKGSIDGLFPSELNALLGGIFDDLALAHNLDRERIAMRISLAFSSVFFLGMAPQAYAGCSGFDYQSQERRQQMVDLLSADLLKP